MGGAAVGAEVLPPRKAPGDAFAADGVAGERQETTGSRPACPPALARAARHVASLGFKDEPDYALLAQCAAELPGPMRGGGGRGRKGAEEAAAEAVEGSGGEEKS